MTRHVIRLVEFDNYVIYWDFYYYSRLVFCAILFLLFSCLWLRLRKDKSKSSFYKTLSLCMATYNLAALSLFGCGRVIDAR
jgi:hypothetical protein